MKRITKEKFTERKMWKGLCETKRRVFFVQLNGCEESAFSVFVPIGRTEHSDFEKGVSITGDCRFLTHEKRAAGI